MLEQEVRNRAVRRIDEMLAKKSYEELAEDLKQQEITFDWIEGAAPHVKQALFVTKMFNKMNMSSDDLIASYMWELNRKKIVPKNPKAYRNMLQEELQVDDKGLQNLFIDRLTN